jgi:peptide/nickel transport system substrate-binding protein
VKFTFERMFNPATGAGNYEFYQQIKGAREMLAGERDNLDEGSSIQDDTHFSFVLSEPSATFIYSARRLSSPHLPHEACAAAGDLWGLDSNAIGTGKYLLESNGRHHAGRCSSVLRSTTANGRFWMRSTSSTTQMAPTKLNAFKNGDIDWCDIGFSLYREYKDDPGFVGNTYPYLPLGLQFVNLNLNDPQLADVRVRQALSLAKTVRSW